MLKIPNIPSMISSKSIVSDADDMRQYLSWYSLQLVKQGNPIEIGECESSEKTLKHKSTSSSCSKFQKFKSFKKVGNEEKGQNQSLFDICGLFQRNNKQQNRKPTRRVSWQIDPHLEKDYNFIANSARQQGKKELERAKSNEDIIFHKQVDSTKKFERKSKVLPKFIPKRETVKQVRRHNFISDSSIKNSGFFNDGAQKFINNCLQKSSCQIIDFAIEQENFSNTNYLIRIHQIVQSCQQCRRNQTAQQNLRQYGLKILNLNKQLKNQNMLLQQELLGFQKSLSLIFSQFVQKQSQSIINNPEKRQSFHNGLIEIDVCKQAQVLTLTKDVKEVRFGKIVKNLQKEQSKIILQSVIEFNERKTELTNIEKEKDHNFFDSFDNLDRLSQDKQNFGPSLTSFSSLKDFTRTFNSTEIMVQKEKQSSNTQNS